MTSCWPTLPADHDDDAPPTDAPPRPEGAEEDVAEDGMAPLVTNAGEDEEGGAPSG